MKNLKYGIALIIVAFISCSGTTEITANTTDQVNYNELSEQFLSKVKNNENTQEIRNKLAHASIEELERALDTNDKKLAFWVNIYNAYIQVFLQENPKLYEDRGSFFKKNQIPIAGDTISFAKIEHGILRKSQWEYGLGYIRKWFPNKLERKLRVDKRDYRIHFALNCGAKDCPPVAIYEWERVNEQFNKGTTQYLKRTTTFKEEEEEVAVTSLFNWFRGDFGGKKGIKKILEKEGLISTTKGIDLSYKNYDWTLDLDNFVDL